MNKLEKDLKPILGLSILLFVVSFASGQSSADQTRPGLKLNVLIDGKQFSINDGDTIRHDSKTIVVRSSKYMTFDYEALSFDFPKHFSYTLDQAEGYKTWTLDGAEFIIMYFVLDVEVGMDILVKEMIEKFGKKNCTLSDRRTRLGDIDLPGKRINISLVGVKLTYDIFTLNTNDGKTHFLAFQDTKGDDGSESQEGLETLDVLNKTIKLKD